MYGWYSEKDAKEKGIIYTYKDVNNSNVMVTKITKENICPYIEESVFGSDCISIGKLIEYVNTKYYQIKYTNLIKTYEFIYQKGN